MNYYYTVRRVRLPGIFLLGWLLLCGFNSIALQEQRKVSLSAKDISIQKVFQAIKKKTGLTVFYSNELLDDKEKITVDFKDEDLGQVLHQILKGKNISYEIRRDKVIVLSPSKESNSSAAMSRPEKYADAAAGIPVKGKLTDEKGEGLPGVSILVKGTQQGLISDGDGNFSIEVPDEQSVLVFSFVGYITQEIQVGNRTAFEITLHPDTKALEEVVVTALGITRETKSLTYSTQKIKGNELSEVKDLNYVNTLAGKVAGAIITRGTMGPGSPSRVLIRGNKSFTGSSSPLYVIDGVPASIEFNPDDVESIQVLPGASAAALYGSQAANGVVLITTKKGQKGSSKIDFSSAFTFEKAIDLPRLQTTYGRTDPQYNDSWGEKVTNGSDRHIREFFKTGTSKINSISFSSGNETTQTYLSYSNSSASGILPENKFSQHNFTLKVSSQYLNNRLSVDGSVNYVKRKIFNQNAIGGYSSLTGVYSFPIDDDWSRYSGDNFEVWDPVRQVNVQNWPYIRNETFPSQNPYWVQRRNQTDDFSNKTIASFLARYKIADGISLQARATYDYGTGHWEKRNYASTQGTIEGPNGGYGISDSRSTGLFTDLLLLADKSINENFTIAGTIGVSNREGTSAGVGLSSTVPTSLSFPNFFSVYALNGLYNKSEYLQKTVSRAVFGNATLGYRERLFLDVTARNEWTSTVSIPFFYPSAGLSYILTESGYGPLSYAKVRGSYSEVGNSLPFGIDNLRPPYALDNAGNIVGRGTLPYFNGADTIQLKPERTRSFEFGTDLRFFNNKLNVSLTYYNARTFDQVFQIQAPAGAGAANFWINGGVIDNRGIEGLVTYSTSIGKVKWTPSLTFSHNKNRILELSDQLDSDFFSLSFHSHGGQVGVRLMRPKDGKYGQFGDMYGRTYLRDESGAYKLNNEGMPQISPNPDFYLGNANPWLIAGLNNAFSYKDLHLSLLVDSRWGGAIFNRTEMWLDYKGLSERTGEARDKGGVEVNGKMVDAKSYYLNQTGAGQTPAASEYFFSATNVRLRELSVGYNLLKNSKVFSNLTLSFIARNLLFLYKKAPFDPEIGVGSSPGNEGHANFVLPSTRSFGFSLRTTLADKNRR